MLRALTRSWPSCRMSYRPLAFDLQPLQSLLFGGLWFPGALPPATGVPPPTGNWPDAIGTAPEKQETDQVA